MSFIPFAKVSMAGKEIQFIQEVLDSGWLTTSVKTRTFEEQFADYVGVKYACAVNSCTAALHLALEAIGIGPGDQVIVPTMTFTATAEVIRYLGGHPVFTDVEYGTCLMTPEILEKAINDHPAAKAVVLVHYGGQSALMNTPGGEGIADLCLKHQIRLIEDAAHAFPARFGDRFIGSFGDATCFSFYANKPITTGEGGLIATNLEFICKRAKVMRLHGIDRDCWDRFTSQKPAWEYDVIAPGFKYNMPDVNAAIGLAQLEKAETFRQQRQRCAMFYMKELSNIPVIDLPVCIGPPEKHAWHLFPIVIKPDAPVSRNDFIALMTQKGIGTSVHYKPLHRMSFYHDFYRLDLSDFPNAERIWQGTVSLPVYPELADHELQYIVDTVKSILMPA